MTTVCWLPHTRQCILCVLNTVLLLLTCRMAPELFPSVPGAMSGMTNREAEDRVTEKVSSSCHVTVLAQRCDYRSRWWVTNKTCG
jgi:hypothetical protein